MTSARLCWDNILVSKYSHNRTDIDSASTLCFAVSLTTVTYSSARCRGQEEGKDALFRKRKVLQLVSHWSRLYKDFLKEEEHVRSFMKVWHFFLPCLSCASDLTSLILLSHMSVKNRRLIHFHLSLYLVLKCGLSFKFCMTAHQAFRVSAFPTGNLVDVFSSPSEKATG